MRKTLIALTLAAASAWMLVAFTLASNAAAATGAMAVCGSVHLGQAHCDAALLVKRGTDSLIRPTVTPVPGGGRIAHDSATTAAAEPAAGSPAWLQQAYDLTALAATKGVGDTVAIVDAFDDPGAASDLATFRSTYGLPVCAEATGCLRIVNEQGSPSPLPAASAGWDVEETLDLQAVSSICPNCSILLVEASSSNSNDLQTAMQTAVNLGANQISDSWSVTATTAPYLPTFLTPRPGAALPAIFAASGDAGADPLGTAEYPAALPTVTAVGGTTLTQTSSLSDPRGYSESAWSDSGSGCALGELPLSYQSSTGCLGRAYSDVSADADPDTGLNVYEAAGGGWATAGGTSLATPMVAAFDALTGVDAGSPQWAYTDAAALNDPTGGSDGGCSGLLGLMCLASIGYDGPTGSGSISGAVVPGAPGIGRPTFALKGRPSDLKSLTRHSVELMQGVYTNGAATTYVWQFGPTSRYGLQTSPVTLPSGAQPVEVSATLIRLKPHATYHYRLVATNPAGTAYGDDMDFTTDGPANGLSPKRARGEKPVRS